MGTFVGIDLERLLQSKRMNLFDQHLKSFLSLGIIFRQRNGIDFVVVHAVEPDGIDPVAHLHQTVILGVELVDVSIVNRFDLFLALGKHSLVLVETVNFAAYAIFLAVDFQRLKHGLGRGVAFLIQCSMGGFALALVGRMVQTLVTAAVELMKINRSGAEDKVV